MILSSIILKAFPIYTISGWTLLLSTSAKLLIPRVQSICDRLQHSLSSPFSSTTPLKLRIRILVQIVIHFTIILPLAAYLWTVDELFFSTYKSSTIEEPVILVSVPRAGTTSLHSLLALDSNTFVTPNTSEFVLPFICIQIILQKLQSKYPHLISKVEKILKRINGVTEEVEVRHPVSLFHPEADDVLIGEWHWSAVGSVRMFPILHHWFDHYNFASFPKSEKDRILNFHSLVCRKVLYNRGGGRAGAGAKKGDNANTGSYDRPKKRLLLRTHLSACFDDFKRIYPDASFIGIMRDPVHVLQSFDGLSDTVIYHATGYKMLPARVPTSIVSTKGEKSNSACTHTRTICTHNLTSAGIEKTSWPNAFVAILSDMMGREARLHTMIQSIDKIKGTATTKKSKSLLKSSVISFENFKRSPIDAITDLYTSIGLLDKKIGNNTNININTYSDTNIDTDTNQKQQMSQEFKERILQQQQESYKSRHVYENPTMDELGIDEMEFRNLDNVIQYTELMKSNTK